MIGIAASVLLAATVGYMAGTFKQATNPDALTSNSTDTQPLAENFAQTVAAYQAFYVRETLGGADNRSRRSCCINRATGTPDRHGGNNSSA